MNVLLLLSFLVHFSFGRIHVYPSVRSLPPVGDPGDRLLLTPYIKNGEIIQARELARVPPMLGRVESYSGFLTVNENHDSNMFFWFFPAENNPHRAPIALWLQGGPGAPSVYAIFSENGPFVITETLDLKSRKAYWSQEINMIYIDNPVGTGFSYTKPNGYVTNESEVGRDLYEALLQFFQLFPEFQQNDFFVTGESYGGKYVPAIAYTIHKNNPAARQKINLKGIAIGNGLVDPENMIVKYGDYLFYHGLIDSKALDKFNEAESEIVTNIQAGEFRKAFNNFDTLLNGDLTKYQTLFYNSTGLKQYFNYATANTNVEDGGSLENFLANSTVRRNIHVGSQKFDEGHQVEIHLLEDVMNSVKPWLEELMDNYRVLLYNGQFDIICAYPLTINYVQKLAWSGKTAYDAAQRKMWLVNGELAGFTKTGGNFTEILVRDAGHMVPADQPVWALDMITKFTNFIPF